jgi:hypothetical protein
MDARQIVDLVDDGGISALSSTFGISRRQAEAMHISALRACHENRGHRELPAEVRATETRRYDRRPPAPGRAFSTQETSALPGQGLGKVRE